MLNTVGDVLDCLRCVIAQKIEKRIELEKNLRMWY